MDRVWATKEQLKEIFPDKRMFVKYSEDEIALMEKALRSAHAEGVWHQEEYDIMDRLVQECNNG